ncbi:DUF4157 domain-containing protein [Streptomyces ziwulingensis]|uniref:DUF4157 domain-containing protein n=1 Tax=Streptomyces ziwulingensis TaxID=1045501 RepID=A0ABP9ANS4_9ACTN
MGLARDESTTTGVRQAPQRPRPASLSAGTAVQRMLASQSQAGNQAVVEMLRRAGHPGTPDQHRHGHGCGHPAREAPVQRSLDGATVARAEEEHDHGHDHVQDSSPAGQSALLAAAMNSPSESLPSSVVAKAGAFYQNDRLASTRVHRDAVAQRATAAMGAQAMTVGHHIFLSAPTGDDRLIGHELSHVDKNLKGLPETGRSNGAGVSVTDPKQDSERAAERDGDAYAAGRATAPSAVAQRSAASAAHQPVQRMPGEGEQAGRQVALQDTPPGLSAEDGIAALPENSEQEVILQRGVTPTQKKYLVREVIRGSFVDLAHMLQAPAENATKPDPEHVKQYVNSNRNEDTAKLIEFSTDSAIARLFAQESRIGYAVTIRIKRKYLAKGATGAENGWIAQQGAPYEIVAVEKRDSVSGGEWTPMDEGMLRAAARNEEMAKYVLHIETITAAEYLKQFEGPKKLEETRKYLAYQKEVYAKD